MRVGLGGPKKWVIVYLLLLLLFPFFYLSFGAQFKHANLSNEADFVNLKNEINGIVEKGISQSIEYGSGEKVGDSLAVTTNGVISSNSLKYSAILFRESVGGQKQNSYLECSIPIDALVRKDSYNAHFMVCGVSKGQAIIGFSESGLEGDAFAPVMFEESDSEKIASYFKGVSGDASLLGYKDNFFRMLYFSAVTITTSGYGDITPINSAARFLVALESVLGIIVMGLFLSSISMRNKANKGEI